MFTSRTSRWERKTNISNKSYPNYPNYQVWTKHGLLLTDPVERGLRVVEISLLTEPAAGGQAAQLQAA